jgi:hypothetical protein
MKNGVSITFDASSPQSVQWFGLLSRSEDLLMCLQDILNFIDANVDMDINDRDTMERIAHGVSDILANRGLNNVDSL